MDGFIGDGASYTMPNSVWRTTDGGATWHLVNYPKTFFNQYPEPVSFTFKNSLEGWFFSCRTTDGGDNWTPTNQPPIQGDDIAYVKASDMVIYVYPANSNYFIANDGMNFTEQTIPGYTSAGANVSITFSDSFHGIIVHSGTYIAYTDDGGLSWKVSQFIFSEMWQPVGISGTETFFGISEDGGATPSNTGQVIRSIDGGKTWLRLYKYPNTQSQCLTGAIQYGWDMNLFFQTTLDGSEGVMTSSDSGITFHSICGPVNRVDTRFYVRDTFIYAGDKYGGLWLNTTGIGSNSTPQLSTLSISAPPLLLCENFDSALTFTFFDSCNNIQAKLLSAVMTGSPSFTFSSASAIPRTIHPEDSLVISYDPQSSLPDTAELHLRFHLGWKDFDTTIHLFGAGRIPKENVRFVASSPTYSAIAGQGVSVSYASDKNISARNLDSISFDLIFDGDVLDYQTISTSIVGASVTFVTAPIPLIGK
ncbi:MAG: hypothetical protein WCH46_07765 [bacterium]